MATATATSAGATGAEGITTIPTAAVFPAAGTRTSLSSATAITTTSRVATTPVTATAAITTTCITTATAVTTPAGSATAIPTAAATTATAGLGLVDAQGATHEFSSLQALDSAHFSLVVGHLHEGEAPLAPRIPLQGKGTAHHLTKGGEQFAHVFLFGSEGEIADKNAHVTESRTSQALTQPA